MKRAPVQLVAHVDSNAPAVELEAWAEQLVRAILEKEVSR